RHTSWPRDWSSDVCSSDLPESAQRLHRLLERQHYRLAHWQLTASEINYRRFFDINGLAGLRVEDIDTFRRVHVLLARLIADKARSEERRVGNADRIRRSLC